MAQHLPARVNHHAYRFWCCYHSDDCDAKKQIIAASTFVFYTLCYSTRMLGNGMNHVKPTCQQTTALYCSAMICCWLTQPCMVAQDFIRAGDGEGNGSLCGCFFFGACGCLTGIIGAPICAGVYVDMTKSHIDTVKQACCAPCWDAYPCCCKPKEWEILAQRTMQ